MTLNKMNRTDLDLYLKGLVKKEREVLRQILETIREVDSRRMYLEMGYASLFEYLTLAVGYSNASAQRRIDGARLLHEIPELGEKIQDGKLKLHQISLVQKAARQVAKTQHKKVSRAEKMELLETLSGQTVQQSQKEIASFFDLPVEYITSQKVQADESVRIELTLNKETYQKLQRAQDLISSAVPDRDLVYFIEYVSEKIIQQRSSVKLGKKAPEAFPENKVPHATQKFQNSEKLQNSQRSPNIQKSQKFQESHESREFQYSQSSQKLQEPQQSQVPDKLKITDQLESAKVNLPSKSETQGDALNIAASRKAAKTQATEVAIPAKTFSLPMWKRKAHARQNCCQYKDPVTGKICGSRFFLQVDHKQPRWANGNNKPDNLQILCAGHNALKYRQEAGIRHVSSR